MRTYCLLTAEITVQIYMQHEIKLQLKLNQMNEKNHNSYIKLPSFIWMKHEVTCFHYIDFNTNNRVPTQILNTQYGHQTITEQKVALDASNRSNSWFHLVRLFCYSYSRSTKVVFLVTLLFTVICALLQNTSQVFIIRL